MRVVPPKIVSILRNARLNDVWMCILNKITCISWTPVYWLHSLYCVLGDNDDTYSCLNVMMQSSIDVDFFTEYGEGSRYRIEEVIGKGSYGVVCSAYDTHTGDKVAIKKINDIFEHVSDATRILREIKLLRLLRHPDIVEIKHILLPPSRREFKDIYVVFELMESDLHQVIKANDDLTPEHYQFFLYQLLRGLKYIHTGHSLVISWILNMLVWSLINMYSAKS